MDRVAAYHAAEAVRSVVRAHHLHRWWSIPGALCDMVALAFPAKRYRSATIATIVHSSQTVFFIAIAAVLLAK
jgi:CAAX protease family protein